MGRGEACTCGCDGCKGARSTSPLDLLVARARRRSFKQRKGGHCKRSYKGCFA